MSDSEQIAAFCSELLGGPDGHGDDRLEGLLSYVWTITAAGTKRTRWLRAENSDAIASACVELANNQLDEVAHIYLGTCLVDEATVAAMGPDAQFKRATNDTAAGIMALCVDIDIAGPEHTSKPYPPDLDSATSIYAATGLTPSLVVNSGNGLHAWWILEEPWLIRDGADPDRERAAMAQLAQDWSSTLRYHADRLGHWKIDSTFDLARVMRVPGTRNVKPTGITRPIIVEQHPEARYDPDDFTAAMVDPEVLEAYRKRTGPGLAVKELPGVDLMQVWARVTSVPYRETNYTPAWLTELLELLPGSPLEATWEGYRQGIEDPSPSGLDASLVRLLHDRGVPTEGQVEAVMCRRLRSGEKVDKVDPRSRTDYLVRTVARIQALAAVTTPAPAQTVEQAKLAVWNQVGAGRTSKNDAATSKNDAPIPQPADPDGTEFGDYANRLLEHESSESESSLARTAYQATQRGITGNGASPPVGLPRPALVAAPAITHNDPWGARHKATEAALAALAALLLPEPLRQAGIEPWRLEYRDFGEQQKGRLVLRVPDDYEWLAETPPTYRPGRPLFCSWYRREAFEVPKGYRWSVTRDALFPALPVGNNREAWASVIDLLVPFWQRDSSGTDLMTQMHEWLLEYLCGHPATLDITTALDNRRALLLDHAEWGVAGEPVLLLFASSFVDYISGRPGSGVGRNAKTQLGYLHLEPCRPRISGADGRTHRVSWLQVLPRQFNTAEWGDVLAAARDAAESATRRLRVVDGGRA
jgi:hypothetical protein